MKSDLKEQALKRAKELADEVDIYTCPITDKEIYFLADKKRFAFESFGTCEECQNHFHVSGLEMLDSARHCDWPIHYVGYYCKECYYQDGNTNDDSEEELELEESEE